MAEQTPTASTDDVLDLDAVTNPEFKFKVNGERRAIDMFVLARALEGAVTDGPTAAEKVTGDDADDLNTTARMDAAQDVVRKAFGFPAKGAGPTLAEAQCVTLVRSFWAWVPGAMKSLGFPSGERPQSPAQPAGGVPTSSDASPPVTATNS